MIKNKVSILFTAFFMLVFSIHHGYAQDRNVYIFLCFGQSNMEGTGKIEVQDTIADIRLLHLQAVDCPDLGRQKGHWYKAKSPLCHCNTGVSPAEQFGKALVQNLPDSITVALIHVAIGGCHIQLFDQDSTAAYVERAPGWMKSKLALYDNNPYKRLVEMAKIGQQKGVIKGILLHQGESNTGDQDWPNKVNKVYTNLLNDLHLEASETPLLAGEMLSAQQDGKCASMNEIINTLPQTIPNAHIVSSKYCEGAPDDIHFSSAGYRKLGNHYADVWLDYYYNRK
ncbi:sialate O-acetylesterase [Sphingobacterium sp. SGR-19]|uniref:sialate O-acetylesterase n=1 Tax=Sphingobacterium sp. SGR-19 TaxID=2710886 RepID=UPI0013EADBCA|nr:sialate O-acetylesterase [Sphingobacterium sp. SGR-19]NGM65020.1 sialate O-acetylesterase [Sphingobacterium sp. SGR-19]